MIIIISNAIDFYFTLICLWIDSKNTFNQNEHPWKKWIHKLHTSIMYDHKSIHTNIHERKKHQLIGLRAKITGKILYFMGKWMVSCRFSLKSTHWRQRFRRPGALGADRNQPRWHRRPPRGGRRVDDALRPHEPCCSGGAHHGAAMCSRGQGATGGLCCAVAALRLGNSMEHGKKPGNLWKIWSLLSLLGYFLMAFQMANGKWNGNKHGSSSPTWHENDLSLFLLPSFVINIPIIPYS